MHPILLTMLVGRVICFCGFGLLFGVIIVLSVHACNVLESEIQGLGGSGTVAIVVG